MPTAALLTQLDSPLTLAEIELLPPEFGQVRVRVLASGICGAQLAEIRGDKGNAGFLPHLLGHEGCGIVEETGPGVSKVKAGDKVVMHWRKGDGLESDFPKYLYEQKQITSGKVVTFTEQATVSENRLTAVPADTPVELCALLGCGLSTALGTVETEAALKFGESVLIVGCGGLGVNLILAAKLRGAGWITAVDIHKGKAHLAEKMGANEFVWNLASLIKPRFDVIIETSGVASAMDQSLPLLKSGGRFIMVGQQRPGAPVTMVEANHMFQGEGKSIRATQGGAFNPSRDIPRYLQMHRNGLLNLSELITHRIPLSEINEGIELVKAGMAGRILVEMEAP